MGTIKLGLGFATGRKSFRKVLKTFLRSWKSMEIKGPIKGDVSLNLFVAYDLNYRNTQSTDYTNLKQEIVDEFDQMIFYGAKNALRSIESAKHSKNFTAEELRSVFGAGYAGKRNAILFSALEHHMDYLLFIDDDEYPMAVTNNHNLCLWSGQNVISTHLNNIPNADFTNGHHCGYISPIPQIQFNEVLTEQDFGSFIDAISNDIINWDKMKQLIASGGVTYASTEILRNQETREVPEIGGCKFISGANLCTNLTRPERTLPFYNPPGARGEDTFLSSLLSDREVCQVPCYTFHDGFSRYPHLLDGVLPIHLSPVIGDSPVIITRFLSAAVGWARYKPLLTFITSPDEYEQKMQETREALGATLPKLAAYFQTERFYEILTEFEKYCKNVQKHHRQFQTTQKTWKKLLLALEHGNLNDEEM